MHIEKHACKNVEENICTLYYSDVDPTDGCGTNLRLC